VGKNERTHPPQLGLMVTSHERAGRPGLVALGIPRRLATSLLSSHRVPTQRLSHSPATPLFSLGPKSIWVPVERKAEQRDGAPCEW